MVKLALTPVVLPPLKCFPAFLPSSPPLPSPPPLQPPGTEEHHLRTGMEPGGHHHAGMGTMGTTTGVTDTGMMGTHGTHGLHHDTPLAGVGGVGGVGAPLAGGTPGAGMMSSSHDTTTGMGHTAGGTGYTEEGKETVGHKIKKMIPGGERGGHYGGGGDGSRDRGCCTQGGWAKKSQPQHMPCVLPI